MHTIYGIKDPRTGRIGYVGRTGKTLPERLQQHVYNSKCGKSKRSVWIRSILDAGCLPEIVELEQVTHENAIASESNWIGKLRSQNGGLTNKTRRGGGGRLMKTETIGIAIRFPSILRKKINLFSKESGTKMKFSESVRTLLELGLSQAEKKA